MSANECKGALHFFVFSAFLCGGCNEDFNDLTESDGRDYGVVANGEIISDTIKLFNPFSQDITVESVRASCQCVIIHNNREGIRIAPGQTAFIDYKWKVTGRENSVANQKICVVFRNPKMQLLYNLAAQIAGFRSPQFIPASLALGALSPGASVSKIVHIRMPDELAESIPEAISLNINETYNFHTTISQGLSSEVVFPLHISLSIPKDAAEGSYSSPIVLTGTTSHKSSVYSVKLPVTYTVNKRVFALPREIVFYANSEKVNCSVLIMSTGNAAPPQVIDIPDLSVQWSARIHPEHQATRLELAISLDKFPREKSITVNTTSGALVLPVRRYSNSTVKQ